MSYRRLLTLLGIVLMVFGATQRGWLLGLIWFGGDFLILGFAYGRGAHGIFGKRPDGTLPLWSWLLFLPLLLYTSAVWHLIRLLSREPAQSVIGANLVVGRRLLSWELEGEFDNFVDLTAEFSEPPGLRRLPSYRCFPILDAAAPTPDSLRQAIHSLRPGRTFIHCAQGHGRTGLFALAFLLESGAATEIDHGLRLLTTVRPAIRLSREQRRCIQTYAEQMR